MEDRKLFLMQQFRDSLVKFVDELIEQYPNEPDFILIRIFIKDQIPMTDILGKFIRDLLPLKDKAEERNLKFFLENLFTYSGLPEHGKRTNHFKEFFGSDKISPTDREIMWQWVDLFISIADSYREEFGTPAGWESITTA